MNYTDKMLWQIIDGEASDEQRFKFLEDCRADPALASRYESVLYMHNLFKTCMGEEQGPVEYEPVRLDFPESTQVNRCN